MSARGDVPNGRAEDQTADSGADRADARRELHPDDVFHLLQNPRRRGVLRYAREHPDAERFEIGDVAEQVAAWENDESISSISSAERQRVYISLYQGHLPKLDEHGVVEYDQSRGVVRPTRRAENVGRYLDVEADGDGARTGTGAEEARATRYYGGATLLGLAVTAGAWVGVVPGLLSSYVGAFVTIVFAAVTLALGVRRRPLP